MYSEASGENENSRSFLNREDIIAVCRLLYTEEEKLDQLSIKDWFDENAHIFTTCFWQLCQTVYGFQKDSGLGEFRRSLNEICGPFLQLSWKEQSLIMDSLKKYRALFKCKEENLAYVKEHFTFNLDDLIYLAKWVEYHSQKSYPSIRFLESIRGLE